LALPTDAHCHPWDLRTRLPTAEEERRTLRVACAASAWNQEQFEYHEKLARNALQHAAPPVILCFAIHPQLPAEAHWEKHLPSAPETPHSLPLLFSLLETLAEENRLDAIGETGFDRYNQAFRDTEAIQDELFTAHLELACAKGLPLVLHVRRAMHKVFAHVKALKKLPAVIFHSWSGTVGEGEALLRRGINAYFSFGAPILLNHHEAMRSCAHFPVDRLLLETDAPYQPLRGASFSHWGNLPLILRGTAHVREEAGSTGHHIEELAALVEGNFYRAYGKKFPDPSIAPL
jgi:TatD DNase family protein